ncbi:MAG TPA: chemotaxis protein CheB [Terriglobia bacterium]|nr:chemotaxis protein CheB [Terriglobia bacterium]
MKKTHAAPARARTKPRLASRMPSVTAPSQNFPVVGIGASAGGFEAFMQFLKHVPADTGMAFVLVQHLAPQHESALAGLLSRGVRLPVTEVRNGMKVEPNHVYVIPPNVKMAMRHGALRLSKRAVGAGQHTPIDFFFQSLAEDRKSGAVGVVLSGTGSDGTAGLKAIKAEGGITFAQDEISAKFFEMPRSAVNAGCVDFVMSPEVIGRELVAIAQHPYVSPAQAVAEVEPAPEAASSLQQIFAIVRKATGLDFNYYRETTLKRRIQRRMLVVKVGRVEDYVDFLLANPGEAAALCQDILICVTSFFRDPKIGEILKRKIFSGVAKKRRADESIRIWVPACSTGEEAYSLAIYLLEYFGENSRSTRLQLFGTDVNENSVQKARAGLYPESIAADVSPQRLRRFFAKTSRGYQISKAVRDLCVFARHDLTRDPPFSNLDLISCRNVLIYLKPELQKKILGIFHYALKPEGYLLLGSAEGVGGAADLFTLVDRGRKFYAKKPGAGRLPVGMGSADFGAPRAQAATAGEQVWRGGFDLQREAQRLLLSRYTPAAVIVDQDLRALRFLGRTGAYLEPAPGEASLNLLKIVREGLAFDILAMVQEARKGGRAVRRERRPVRINGGSKPVNLEVAPLAGPSARERYFMVVFEPSPPAEVLGPAAGAGPPEQAGGRRPRREDEAGELRRELEKAQKYLQAITEEHEAASEELRAANEEILSSNEELQSTNEELETAKEELQSTNEELITLNEELQNRNAELNVVNNDLVNLLSSVNIPVVILDNETRIRRFTPAAERVFNIIPTDVGRRISDLRHTLEFRNLEALIEEVVDTVSVREAEVRDADGHWYSLRVRPYKTTDNRIAGTVLALVDIHLLKSDVRHQEQLLDLVPDSVAMRDLDSRITFWNHGSELLYGYTREEALGAQKSVLLKTVFPAPAEEIRAEFLRRGRWTGELVETTKDGRLVTVLSHWTVLPDERGRPRAAVEINHDITERNERERQLAESERRYRRFFERNVAGNFRASLEGRVLDCNDSFARLLGVERSGDVTGASLTALGVEASEWQRVAARLREAKSVSGHDIHLLRKDGTAARLALNASLVADGQAGPGVVEGFALDVTRPRRLEASLKELAGRAMQLQDEERQRYGRQLHEVVGTSLVALTMNLSAALKAAVKDEDAQTTLAESLELGKQILRQVRTVSYLLHPPLMHEMGLKVALHWYVEGFGERSGIKVDLEVDPEVDALPAEVENALLRILQESLSNIHRHAGAQTAQVRVRRAADTVRVEVLDDGRGFEIAKLMGKAGQPGLGLVLMEERAKSVGGRLDVESRPGDGTSVRVSLPLAGAKP